MWSVMAGKTWWLQSSWNVASAVEKERRDAGLSLPSCFYSVQDTGPWIVLSISRVCAGVLSNLVKPLWGYPHHYTHVYRVCFLGGSTSYQADSEDDPPWSNLLSSNARGILDYFLHDGADVPLQAHPCKLILLFALGAWGLLYLMFNVQLLSGLKSYDPWVCQWPLGPCQLPGPSFISGKFHEVVFVIYFSLKTPMACLGPHSCANKAP